MNHLLEICIILFLPAHTLISGQFLINGINSYLCKEFNEIREKIFPKDLRINISMSRIEGTLLYSIDRNMNQLIISLSNPRYPFITIEFNTWKNILSLSKLCGCDRCEYTNIDLLIQIEDSIHVRCNRRASKYLQFAQNGKLNNDYPLPYSVEDSKTHGSNAAQLYLVNTPKYKYPKPNLQQLSGCIFKVAYDGYPLEFTDITRNIERRCLKLCTNTLCNRGRCHEIFGGQATCDCQSTGSGGKYCNESIKQASRQFIDGFQAITAKVFGWALSCLHFYKFNEDLTLLMFFGSCFIGPYLFGLCLNNARSIRNKRLQLRQIPTRQSGRTITDTTTRRNTSINSQPIPPCQSGPCVKNARRRRNKRLKLRPIPKRQSGRTIKVLDTTTRRTTGIDSRSSSPCQSDQCLEEPIFTASTDEIKCSICLNEFNGEVAQLAGCKHEFCVTCIEPWFECQQTCPLDRSEVNDLILLDKYGGTPLPEKRVFFLNWLRGIRSTQLLRRSPTFSISAVYSPNSNTTNFIFTFE